MVSRLARYCARLLSRTSFLLRAYHDAFAAATRSDHLALLRAYEGYRRALGRGAGAAKLYCAENFLSPTALQQMEEVCARPARKLPPCASEAATLLVRQVTRDPDPNPTPTPTPTLTR